MGEYTRRLMSLSVVLIATLIIYVLVGDREGVALGVITALLTLIYLGGAKDGKE